MRFLRPDLLWWTLLIAAPIVLYFFRRKPKVVRISTLPFFKALAREHQESPWLRRLKRLLSLLFSLLVILAAAGSLSRPVLSPHDTGVRNVVILIDGSASMGARSASGKTALEIGKAEVRRRLAGLPAGVPVTVAAYHRRARIMLPQSFDRRDALRAVDAVQVRPMEGNEGPAMRLAERLARLKTPAAIWHVTDMPAGTGEPVPDDREVQVSTVRVVASSRRNAGITSFQLRGLPMANTKFEAFVRIDASGPDACAAKLEERIDGKLTCVRSLTLEPGSAERLVISVDAGAGQVLSLKLVTAGDVLAADDTVSTLIPERVPLNVLWVSPEPDPFMGFALMSLQKDGSIEIYQAGPEAWPVEEKIDVTILDGWLPKEWPGRTAVVVINPPGPLGPVRAAPISGGGLPIESIRVTDGRHPLLHGIASARVAVTQTAVLEKHGALRPLWIGVSGPILAAGEVDDQRIAVMAFAPQDSARLPLMASYPLLVGNLIYWAGRPASDPASANTHRTGDLLALQGTELEWRAGEFGRKEAVTVPISGRWTELDKMGVWQTDAGKSGTAALLSWKETVLTAPREDERDGAASKEVRASMLGGNLAPVLLWLAAAVLVVESWLFHRHTVN